LVACALSRSKVCPGTVTVLIFSSADEAFWCTSAKGPRSVKGFRTGDLVRATVTSGKKLGCYEGRVAVRSSGSFNVTTGAGTIQGISHRYCRVIHRADGYGINRAIARSQNSSPSIAAQDGGYGWGILLRFLMTHTVANSFSKLVRPITASTRRCSLSLSKGRN
jgi:hypothetical protein